MYACLCVYVITYTDIHTHLHACIDACLNVCICIVVRIFICMHIHTHIHPYIHAYPFVVRFLHHHTHFHHHNHPHTSVVVCEPWMPTSRFHDPRFMARAIGTHVLVCISSGSVCGGFGTLYLCSGDSMECLCLSVVQVSMRRASIYE